MDNGKTAVLVVATMDTKAQEAHYVESCLKSQDVVPILLDAGIRGESPAGIAVTRDDVIRASGRSIEDIHRMSSEGEAMAAMVEGATRCALSLYRDDRIKGIIGLGGSMGTTLGTGVMRAFPLGFPKVMISTMGAQNMRSFVGTRDILVLNSVSDLAGLNRMTRKILLNGASAICGMAKMTHKNEKTDHPLVYLTSMGPTETCARTLRSVVGAKGVEAVTFHSNGAGGKAMEQMIGEEKVDAVADLSLHELVDRHFGGAFDPGPDRCTASIDNRIPTLFVPGNIDFLVAGCMEEAKARFGNRRYHRHNAHITCVGSTLPEITHIARLLAGRCNRGKGPIAVLIPEKGFSDFSKAGGPLENIDGPPVFANAFLRAIKRSRPVHFKMLPYHINDQRFTTAMIATLEKISPRLGYLEKDYGFPLWASGPQPVHSVPA